MRWEVEVTGQVSADSNPWNASDWWPNTEIYDAHYLYNSWLGWFYASEGWSVENGFWGYAYNLESWDWFYAVYGYFYNPDNDTWYYHVPGSSWFYVVSGENAGQLVNLNPSA